MTFPRSAAALVLSIAVQLLAPALAPAASLHLLHDLPGGVPGMRAWDVSADGSTVVGDHSRGAYRWDPINGIRTIGNLPESPDGVPRSGRAVAVSGEGRVVVGEAWGPEGFRWDAKSKLQGIGDIGSGRVASLAFDISDDASTIVGLATPPSTIRVRAFRWTAASGMQSLGDPAASAYGVSADGSVIVGEMLGGSGIQAFRWDATDGMRGLGGFTNGGGALTSATSVSADGRAIIGWSTIAGTTGFTVGFRWLPETGFQPIGHLASATTIPHAVTANGQVIVGESGEAFIWDPVHGIRPLDVMLAQHGIDVSGWSLRSATGISADGLVIVGNGVSPDGTFGAWIAVVPEPSTAVLLGLGLSALALRRRA